MSDDLLPEPDRSGASPHPRFATTLFGHGTNRASFEAAMATSMPHGWMLSGPKGVGKATFAWAAARALLTGAPELTIGPEDPLARRVTALSEPRLALLRRSWDDRAKRLKSQITVDEVRKLHGFLGLAAPDGGRRVVLIDAADEMNLSAANAVLKLLEEPPDDAVFLLVVHRTDAILPTIKSRCRTLRFGPLGADDLRGALSGAGLAMLPNEAGLLALSAGSAGAAAALIEEDGLSLYEDLLGLMATCPDLDRARALALANSASGREAEARRDLIVRLFETLLSRLAAAGAGRPPVPWVSDAEAQLAHRLAPDLIAAQAWAETLEQVSSRVRRALAVNLDPSGLILDMVLSINGTAGRVAQP
ncbi:MAG: DNA polymerase III subunit delta' [Pseudomonadota bacterium]